MTTITITLSDNFDWDNYEKTIYDKVIKSDTPVEVLWDLREMTKMPSFDIILKHVDLMNKEKRRLHAIIMKNIVIVTSNENKGTLLWLFESIQKPNNPTVIYTAEEWNSLSTFQ